MKDDENVSHTLEMVGVATVALYGLGEEEQGDDAFAKSGREGVWGADVPGEAAAPCVGSS